MEEVSDTEPEFYASDELHANTCVVLQSWSRGVARWFRRSLSVADSFVRVEESTTGCRCSLAVSAVSSFVPV
jgi:hypothetical protein